MWVCAPGWALSCGTVQGGVVKGGQSSPGGGTEVCERGGQERCLWQGSEVEQRAAVKGETGRA